MVEVSDREAGSGQPVQAPVSRISRVLNLLRWVLLVVVIAFAVYQISSEWDKFTSAIKEIHPFSLTLSLVLVILGQIAGTFSWQTLVDDMGPKVGVARGSQVFLVGQLGKYVPGSIWAYVLQMELGKKYGIARARVFAASLISTGIAVVAAMLLGTLALPVLFKGHRELLWLYLLLPIGLICLHPAVISRIAQFVFKVLRKEPLDHDLRKRIVGRSLGWSLISYTCFGAHLWLLLNSVSNPGATGLLMCIGVLAVAMTAGLFAFILPSGVGVREAVIVAGLTTVIDDPQALALAVVSRVLFVITDLLVAGGATGTALMSRRHHPAKAPATS